MQKLQILKWVSELSFPYLIYLITLSFLVLWCWFKKNTEKKRRINLQGQNFNNDHIK